MEVALMVCEEMFYARVHACTHTTHAHTQERLKVYKPLLGEREEGG